MFLSRFQKMSNWFQAWRNSWQICHRDNQDELTNLNKFLDNSQFCTLMFVMFSINEITFDSCLLHSKLSLLIFFTDSHSIGKCDVLSTLSVQRLNWLERGRYLCSMNNNMHVPIK